MNFRSLKLKYLILGAISLFLGIWITYAYFYGPLLQAQAGDERVKYSIKAIFASPLCIIVGIGVMVMAFVNSEEKLKELAQSRLLKGGAPKTKKDTLITILIFLLVFIPPVLLYLWFKNEMAKYGYDVRF